MKALWMKAPRWMALLLIISSPAQAWPEKWGVVGVEGSSIRFSTPEGALPPSPLQLAPLGIREPQMVGVLQSEPKAPPYLLVSGVTGDAKDRALFLVRADGGLKPQRLTYPGRLLDPKDRTLVYESRLFYGQCLFKQKYDAIVVFQREHMDRKRGLQRSVYIVEAAPSMLDERLLERGLPSLSTVQLKIRSKQCTEITGRNRPFDMNYFSLRSRRGADLLEGDSDEDDREALKKAEFDAE